MPEQRYPAVVMLLWDGTTPYAARLTSREPLDFEFAPGASFVEALIQLYRQEDWQVPDGHATCPEPVIAHDERVRLDLQVDLTGRGASARYAAYRETFAGVALSRLAFGDTLFHALSVLPERSPLERGA